MTTIDDSLSEIRSVRNDIWHCRKLLQHDLPDAAREMIEKFAGTDELGEGTDCPLVGDARGAKHRIENPAGRNRG